MKIAVFASGNGSNFQVIAEQFPVEFVFSDHRDAYVLERAKNIGVASYAFELKEFDNKATYEEDRQTLGRAPDRFGLLSGVYENCWPNLASSLRRPYHQYSPGISP